MALAASQGMTAQAPAAFDAVDIKLAPGAATVGIFPPVRSGRWRYRGTLDGLAGFAYNLHCCGSIIDNGPAWVKTQGYIIDATTTAKTVPDAQLRQMVQRMITEQFHLVSHESSREASVIVLDQAAGGAKLRPASAPCEQGGFIVGGSADTFNCGVSQRAGKRPDEYVMYGRSITMPEFAQLLERGIVPSDDLHPVVDRTGLTGKYDFELTYQMLNSPNGSGPDPQTLHSNLLGLQAAMAKQLGLKLDMFHTVKATIPIRVIDKAEKPNP